ncbi:MAG: peptidoglycan binding domain-containing protein, partial [Candidatus Limnocylindrales bacterium]
MTTTTPETIAIPAGSARRPSVRKRFAIAFVLGLLVALAAGVGAIYAYDQQYVNRVLPGVRIGAVDLSGLDAGTAAERLRTEYAGLAQGEIVLAGPDGPISISYEAVGRRPDVDAMVAEAMGVGRSGNPLERVVTDARTAIRGATVAPRVAVDADLVTTQIAGSVDQLTIDPIEASVRRTGDGPFVVQPSHLGRRGETTDAVAQAIATLGSVDAPARLELAVPITILPPTVTTDEATAAKVMADRLTERLTLPIEDIDKPQFITNTRLREWTSFATTPDGGYVPTIDTTQLPAMLATLARRIDRAPVNASFETQGGKITGVVPSQNG